MLTKMLTEMHTVNTVINNTDLIFLHKSEARYRLIINCYCKTFTI